MAGGFGGSVKLTGESEYKKALNQITQNLKEVSANMKLVTSSYDKNDNSLSALQDRHKVYNQQLIQQEDRLEVLTDKYNDMVKTYGKNSDAQKELTEELTKAKTELQKIENEVGTTSERYTEQIKIISQLEGKQESFNKAISNASIEMKKAQADVNQTKLTLDKLDKSIEDAKHSTEEMNDSLSDVEESSNEASGGFTVLKGALSNLVADGINKAVDAMKSLSTESLQASNKLQAMLGLTTKELKEFNKEMTELYNANYGESLQDIGDKMAYVKQVTGEVDTDNISKLTENAIALEDTFGSDFNETIRGVSNLMDHFGISSEDAFDLFAKGSQLGLDYTSELGDNIAEYSGNFQQAGYTAEEYFQLLVNGSQNGAYNLDKVNDSINEAKNRLGDGSIKKEIQQFSKETQTAFKNWEKGKGTMKTVIDSMVKDIGKAKSEQKALTLAQIAFGTMGEDANLKVVKSLTTTGEAFEDVKGTMEEIKDIRYNDLTSSIQTLGRKLTTSLAEPIKNRVLPVVKEFVEEIDWEKFSRKAEDGVNKIIDVFSWFIENKDVFVSAINMMVAGFGVAKIGAFVTTFSTVIKAFTSAPTIIGGVTSAMKLLNITVLANPYVALATGIGVVVAGLVTWAKTADTTINKMKDETKEIQSQTQEILNNKESWDELLVAKQDSINAGLSELDYYQGLYSELTKITDANGKVKDGYEGRAKFITGELNQALGTEISMTDNVIDKYEDLTKSFDTLMDKKRAMVILESQEETYKTAMSEKAEVLTSMNELEEDLLNKKLARQSLELQLENEHHLIKKQNIKNQLEEVDKQIEETQKQYETQEGLLENYVYTIGSYESNMALFHEGKYNEMSQVNYDYLTKFKDVENQEKEILLAKIEDTTLNLNTLKELKEQYNTDIYNSQIQAAEEQLKRQKEDLANMSSTVETGNRDLTTLWATGQENTLAILRSKQPEFWTNADEQMKKYIGGITKNEPEVFSSANRVGNKAVEGLNKKESAKTSGTNTLDGYKTGLDDSLRRQQIFSSASSLGSGSIGSLNSALGVQSPSKETKKSGEFFLDGLYNGIENQNKRSSIFSAVSRIGNSLLSRLKSALKERSPSKATQEMGEFLLDGLNIGIIKKENTVLSEVSSFGKSLIKEFNGSLQENNNLKFNIDTSNLRNTNKLIKNAIQTDYDLNVKSNLSNNSANSDKEYNNMVNAFKQALKEVKVVLDDREFGTFVEDTMEKVVYN